MYFEYILRAHKFNIHFTGTSRLVEDLNITQYQFICLQNIEIKINSKRIHLYYCRISPFRYYRNKDKNLPTYKDFLNVSIMELLVDQFTMAKKLMADNKCEKRMRLGETSSVSGGLPIVAESFVAGFL